MAESSLSKRLGIKPGQRVLILNAPEHYAALLGELPDDIDLQTAANGQFDVVQTFVYTKADVDRLAPIAMQSLKPGGQFWFAHPKKSSKVKTDVSRDDGWDVLTGAGWAGIATISIDETWSGIRFRPETEIKRRNPASH